jgi:hypothetical protein
MRDRLVAGDAAVEAPQGAGMRAAGSGDRLEAEAREDARGARIPRVRDHEQAALVELPEARRAGGGRRGRAHSAALRIMTATMARNAIVFWVR